MPLVFSYYDRTHLNISRLWEDLSCILIDIQDHVCRLFAILESYLFNSYFSMTLNHLPFYLHFSFKHSIINLIFCVYLNCLIYFLFIESVFYHVSNFPLTSYFAIDLSSNVYLQGLHLNFPIYPYLICFFKHLQSCLISLHNYCNCVCHLCQIMFVFYHHDQF